MFTLKLYQRRQGRLYTKVVACHHVQTKEIAPNTLEIWTFDAAEPAPYETYYIGERTSDMTALTDENHWEWGLLENGNGRTSEHYRPYTYG